MHAGAADIFLWFVPVLVYSRIIQRLSCKRSNEKFIYDKFYPNRICNVSFLRVFCHTLSP